MLKIYFDNTEIDSDHITSLSQSAQLFDDAFRLGSTLCRTINLGVSKYTEITKPDVVLIKENNVTLFTLSVDEMKLENENTYAISLVDSMVKFNTQYDWSTITDPTVQDVLDAMCEDILSTEAPTMAYGSDIPLPYQDIQARDIISYAAEINGCFARISATNVLEFVPFGEHEYSIDANECADLSIGEEHVIERVYYEQGVASYAYPETYMGDKNTLYLNPENALITDSGSYTIQSIVQHIYSLMDGFTFFNVDTSRCQFDQNIKAGDMINIVLNESYILTCNNKILLTASGQRIRMPNGKASDQWMAIAQIDWNYNTKWIGGFNLELETKQQEETCIVNTREKLNKVLIKVDREIGEISQRVTNTEYKTDLVSSNMISQIDIMFGQSNITVPPTVPTVWSTLPPQWNDSLQMWARAKTTFFDSRVEDGEPIQIGKEASKVVYSISELYYCTDSANVPEAPTAHVPTALNVYNQWTRKFPEPNSEHTAYYWCIEISYTNGSYSWTPVYFANDFASLPSLRRNVETINDEITTVRQKANGLDITVQEITNTTIPDIQTRTTTLETCVSIQSNGVRISQGSLGAYTLLTDDGMEIYAEGNKVAFAKNDGFYAVDYIMNGWHMVTANDNNSFCFVRKEYN